jgi:mycothiol S-conjugate amidase
MWEARAASGQPSPFAPPPDATPEQLAAIEEQMRRMLTPDEEITTWIDVSDVVDQKWAAINRHVTQIAKDSFFLAGGIEGWRRFWGKETFVLKEARVAVETPETDLFNGLPAS